MLVGKDQFPLFRKKQIEKIDDAVDGKDPHESKMQAHAFCQPERNVEGFVE